MKHVEQSVIQKEKVCATHKKMALITGTNIPPDNKEIDTFTHAVHEAIVPIKSSHVNPPENLTPENLTKDIVFSNTHGNKTLLLAASSSGVAGFLGAIATKILADILAVKDNYTAAHSERVSIYSVIIAQGLGLKRKEQETIRRAALIHDIGKIAIPDSILNKSTKPTKEEWEVMKSHIIKGRKLISPYEAFLPEAEIAFSHHERYDGKGYPDGLAKNQIPLGAQIIALADAFDSMTSDRPYRKSLPIHIVLDEIQKNKGTQFAPTVVEAFMTQSKKILQTYQKTQQGNKLFASGSVA